MRGWQGGWAVKGWVGYREITTRSAVSAGTGGLERFTKRDPSAPIILIWALYADAIDRQQARAE